MSLIKWKPPVVQYLTKRNPEMIGIVKGVQEIFVERMNVLQSREAIEDSLKLFAKCFRCELDFSCIEAFAQRQQLFIVPFHMAHLLFC